MTKVNTPVPVARRQVQPLVRPRVSFNTSTDFVLPVIEMTRRLFQPQDLDDFDICYDLGTPHKMPPNPECYSISVKWPHLVIENPHCSRANARRCDGLSYRNVFCRLELGPYHVRLAFVLARVSEIATHVLEWHLGSFPTPLIPNAEIWASFCSFGVVHSTLCSHCTRRCSAPSIPRPNGSRLTRAAKRMLILKTLTKTYDRVRSIPRPPDAAPGAAAG